MGIETHRLAIDFHILLSFIRTLAPPASTDFVSSVALQRCLGRKVDHMIERGETETAKMGMHDST